jgi:hypothetical protein
MIIETFPDPLRFSIDQMNHLDDGNEDRAASGNFRVAGNTTGTQT